MTDLMTTPATAPHANGAGPRMPKHYQWVDVPEYEGFKVRVWTNAPYRILLDLDSGDIARIKSAISHALVETNDWCDYDGDPLPEPADADAFFEKVPMELLAMALRAFRTSGSVLPNLTVRASGRSASG